MLSDLLFVRRFFQSSLHHYVSYGLALSRQTRVRAKRVGHICVTVCERVAVLALSWNQRPGQSHHQRKVVLALATSVTSVPVASVLKLVVGAPLSCVFANSRSGESFDFPAWLLQLTSVLTI